MATTKKTTAKTTSKTTKAAAKPAAKKVVKKTAAPKAAPKAVAKNATVKKAGTKAAAAPKSTGLHYDKAAVIKEYNTTFDLMMKATVFSIGGVLLYFFFMATFLGGFSHEKTNSFVEKFSDRIDLGSSYDGLKLPMYETEE